jgi:hypothetical protein
MARFISYHGQARKGLAMPTEENTFALKLRQLSEAIDALGITYGSLEYNGLVVYTYTAHDYAAMVKRLTASAYVGDGEKSASDYYSTVSFGLTVDPSILIQIKTTRTNVCRKVQTGTRIEEIPDPTVTVPMVSHEVPVYEWECSPILANLDTPEA